MAPDYENLTLIQKCEVFEYALENTTGQDLYRVLWFKSDSSEHWLDRRTTYTRSLAVNSMVGHILGLGDRHPSNLLLHRATGKVIHIDFGDCFEVAMNREKFPEKIPFRLTRMLTSAMEVSYYTTPSSRYLSHVLFHRSAVFRAASARPARLAWVFSERIRSHLWRSWRRLCTTL
jgi:phosphatidylinositol kinase/protein kinase (PI-3  family)